MIIPILKSKECDTIRKTYPPEFKSKLVPEVLRGKRMLNEIASDYEVHPNIMTRWKTDAINTALEIHDFRMVGGEERLI